MLLFLRELVEYCLLTSAALVGMLSSSVQFLQCDMAKMRLRQIVLLKLFSWDADQ